MVLLRNEPRHVIPPGENLLMPQDFRTRSLFPPP